MLGRVVDIEGKKLAVLPVQDESDIDTAVGLGRAMAKEAGFEHADLVRVDTIITKLVSNVLSHPGEGTIALQRVQRPKRNGKSGKEFGLEIIAKSDGQHRLDLASVLAGKDSKLSQAGTSVTAVRRLADEFAIESPMRGGTQVRACKWARNSN